MGCVCFRGSWWWVVPEIIGGCSCSEWCWIMDINVVVFVVVVIFAMVAMMSANYEGDGSSVVMDDGSGDKWLILKVVLMVWMVGKIMDEVSSGARWLCWH